MNNLSDSYFGASDVNVGTNAFLTFASFCFFIGLQFCLAGQCIPRELKKSKIHWKWINIMVSFSHSFLMTLLLSFSFYVYPEMLKNPLTFHNTFINAVICFTTGYFIWDTYDMAQSGNLFKMWEIVVHHVGVLFNLVYNLFTSRYLALSMIALTVEANSIFLHARKLLQMSGRVGFSSWVYVKVCQINLVTFVAFRGTVLIFATWAWFYYFSIFTTSYINILGSVLFTSWPMNIILLCRLVKSDILRNNNSNNSSSSSNNNSSNNHTKLTSKEATD